MEYKLSELINVPQIQNFIDSFYGITGLAVTLAEIDGNTIIANSKWSEVCVKFHRANKISRIACEKSDQEMANEIKSGKNFVVKTCRNGLTDVCMPIKVNGSHIGLITIGQFFFEQPNMEFFKIQSRKMEVDEEQYLAEIRKVPIISQEKFKQVVSFLIETSQMLAEMGYTNLKQLEIQRKLQLSEERWQYAFMGSGDGIWDWDIKSDHVFYSDRYMEMLGYSNNEKWLSSNEWKSSIHPDDLEGVLNEHRKCFNNELINCIVEYRLRCKDGNYKWILGRSKVIGRSSSGEPLRMVGTHEDITLKKQMEEELKKAKEVAEQASQYKSEYIANMSHELRTPLNVILSALQLLRLYNEQGIALSSEKSKKHLNSMRQNSYRLLRLVNNLIDTTKIDAGFYNIKLHNFNIVKIVKDIVLSVSEYAKLKDIKVVFRSYADQKVIACDLDSIERIILNLLSNAIKFTKPGGKIRVSISSNSENIWISVTDTGIGIPAEKQDIIFERYRQAFDLSYKQYEGSGIGLSLAKLLVELHRGRLTVKSKYGYGSKFIIELPLKVLSNDDQAEENITAETNDILLVQKMNVEFSDIYS